MKRFCVHCGKEFETNKPNQIYCKGPHYRPCPVCGKPVKMIDNDFTRPPKCCSYECSHIKRKQNFKPKKCEICGEEFIPKSGVQLICEKEHYSTCAICGKPILIEHANDIRVTCSKECFTQYMKQKSMYRCRIHRAVDSIDVASRNKESLSKLISLSCNQSIQLNEFVYAYELPDNILVNIHNTIQKVDRYYCRDKTQVAEANGYRCIHIFDWDDVDKIVDMLMPKKLVYARDCKIYILKSSVTNEFLNRYHLQGTCRGQLMSLGLIYQDELVQVMTFGKSRYVKHPEVELLRLCTKPGVSVVGGASKLFQFFVKTYEVNDVISYCDRSKFSGDVYEKLGMKLTRTTPPQEIWSREYDKITANLLRQRGYDQLFKTNYGKGASNEQLMLENGWLPVYDCGQKVYQYHGDNYIEYKLV